MRSHHYNSMCPHCTYIHDRASNAFDDRAPQEGDVTICIRCGLLSVFEPDGLRLRKPTQEESIEFAADERIQKLTEAWKTLPPRGDWT